MTDEELDELLKGFEDDNPKANKNGLLKMAKKYLFIRR